MQFLPTDQGVTFFIAPNTAVIVGRQPKYQLTSPRVSRQHVELSCSEDSSSVIATAHKRIEVMQGTETVIVVPAGQQLQLFPGDTVYLERDGGKLRSGFTLVAPTTPAATTPGHKPRRPPSSNQPAAKRLKSEAPAAHKTTLSQHDHQHTGGLTAGGVSGGALGLTADLPSPAQQQQPQQVFAGVQLAVWDQHHTQKAVALAAQAGARVKQHVDSSTTHIIASYSMTVQEADKFLLDSKEQQQQAANITGIPSSQGGLHVTRQLQFSSSQSAAALQDLSSQPLELQDPPAHEEHEHIDGLLVRGVHCVTVKWLTDSLAAGRLQPERNYHTQLHQYQFRLGRSTDKYLQHKHNASGAAEQHCRCEAGEMATGRSLPSAQVPQEQLPFSRWNKSDYTQSQQPMLQYSEQPSQAQPPAPPSAAHQQNVPPSETQICRSTEEWGTGNRWIEPWDEAAAQDTVDQLLSHWHRLQSQKRSENSLKVLAAEDGARSAAASAQGTPEVEDHLVSSDGLSSNDGHSSDDSVEAKQRSKRRLQRYRSAAAAAAGAPLNTVCSHTACSCQTFCFVAEMEKLKGTYSRGREDQFRIKAANRAIHELEKAERPLVSAADVTALGVGDKTTDKLLEILQTGKLRRNEEVAGSERHQVMALFMSVWGVAESTAEKWYQAGCKTLQDVRDKVDHLTTQQRVGLKYFDDFEQRIPRDEVTEAENIVHQAVADSLQELSGKSRLEVTDLMHARVTGSYLRGRRTCGDIDFIISPGPATANLVGLGPLMQSILTRLQAQHCITEDMVPLELRKAMRGPRDEVTWMGVWKGPSSPCYRRIDIKLYPRDELAFAVNYFSSGQDMCRALRYWCNHPVLRVAAAAAALNPAGNAFRLSDRDLVVIRRQYEGMLRRRADSTQHPAAAAAVKQGEQSTLEQTETQGFDTGIATLSPANIGHSRMGNGGRGVVRETIVGPAIKCTCETDIFRAIGLSYVPPHMRDIT